MYTAVVIYEEDRPLLLQSLEQFRDFRKRGYAFTHNGTKLPHHMTINLNKFDETLNPELELDEEVELVVDGFLYNDTLGVCCARVVEAKTAAGLVVETINPGREHITMCLLPPDGKPMKSRELFGNSKEFQLDEPVVVGGLVLEVH